MTQAATPPEPPTAAPAAEAFAQEWALLSEMEALSVGFAREFKVHAVAALQERQDMAEAGAAETRFTHLYTGMRRSIALKARLHEQRQKARHAAEDRRDAAQAERAERRRAVAQGVIQAIDAATPDAPEARERLTGEMWDRLDTCDRIDVDRPDTVPPIDVLIRQMCRNLGIKPEGPVFATGTEPEGEDGAEEAETLSVAGIRFRRGRFRRVPSAELGRPPTEHYMFDTDTDEIFPPPPPPLAASADPDGAPPDPGDARPSAATGPPGGPSDEELIAAEIRRREAQAWQRLRAAVHLRAAGLG